MRSAFTLLPLLTALLVPTVTAKYVVRTDKPGKGVKFAASNYKDLNKDAQFSLELFPLNSEWYDWVEVTKVTDKVFIRFPSIEKEFYKTMQCSVSNLAADVFVRDMNVTFTFDAVKVKINNEDRMRIKLNQCGEPSEYNGAGLSCYYVSGLPRGDREKYKPEC